MLRLKKNKSNEARRMLLRNSQTGKILIVSTLLLVFKSAYQHLELYPLRIDDP